MTADGGTRPRRTSAARRALAAFVLALAPAASFADGSDAPLPVARHGRPAAPPAETPTEPDPWTDKVWAAVGSAPKSDADAAVADRIVRLGTPAIPAVFSIYRSIDGNFRAPVKRSTLLAAFRGFPAADVVAFLATKVADGAPRDTLVAALQVAGAVAGRNCTKVALAAAFRLSPLELRSPALGGVARATLAATLQGDPEGWSELRLAWPALDPSLRAVALEAIDETSSAEGIKFLAELLGDEVKPNVEVLRHMCRMPRLSSHPLGDDTVHKIRWMTKDRAPSLRAAAILFLGRVREPSAFGLALSLLDDPSADVADAALGTLRRTTGAAMSADPESWTQWRLADDAWRESGMAKDVALLESKSPALVVATLKSLGARPLHAKDLWRDVAARTTADDAAVRLAACEALGSLEDPDAVAALVAALSDADPGVAKAAGAALNAVTGLRLPADPAAWRTVAR